MMTSPAEPLLTNAEMAATDRAAAQAGLPVSVLMEAAGHAVADAAGAMAQAGATIAVLCGPGNNGGDGYVAARLLAKRGYAVTLFRSEPPKGAGAAAEAAARWSGETHPLSDFAPEAFSLVVDALYGAGLSRPPDGADAAAIAALNASGGRVLAVDIPSGLHGDTGQALGEAVRATRTISFFKARPGHYLWPGRALCGDLVITQIGLNAQHLDAAATPLIWRNDPGLWREMIPLRRTDTHKYRNGHVLVVSGGAFQTGAARLAAQAALHAGAGAVTLCGTPEALHIHAAHVTAIMLREARSTQAFQRLLAHKPFQAIVLGPGAGINPATRDRLDTLLAGSVPAILDADALSVIAARPDILANRTGATDLVLTPHEGEFQRVFGPCLLQDDLFARLPALLRHSKIERARAAARLSRSVIVYKGPDTVIAAPDGRAALNTNAGPELASAGSGDVLAGVIAAQIAQDMPAFEAAASAVWLHAETGARYGSGLTAERLVNALHPLAKMCALTA